MGFSGASVSVPQGDEETPIPVKTICVVQMSLTSMYCEGELFFCFLRGVDEPAADSRISKTLLPFITASISINLDKG